MWIGRYLEYYEGKHSVGIFRVSVGSDGLLEVQYGLYRSEHFYCNTL